MAAADPPYDLYFRNPSNYIRELLEMGAPTKFAWDRGTLAKRRIDPVKFAQLHLDITRPWDSLSIGDQGAAHYDQDHTDSPLAVYPVWEGHEDINILEELMENPFGENEEFCSDPTLRIDERPVLGQRHMVVVTRLPPSETIAGRRTYATINAMQQDHPEVTLYLHGSYSYRMLFGSEFRAGDVDPRTQATGRRLALANGRKSKIEQRERNPQSNIIHIRPHGFTVKELEIPRNCCMFNIRTAIHASKWYKDDNMVVPSYKKSGEVDTESSDRDYIPLSNKKASGRPKSPMKPGDKIQCDTCSLQDECKFYRDGAVCSLSESEVRKLSEFFKTRDSGVLMQGLQELLVRQADRLESSTNAEHISGEVDPEIDKQINKLFDNTVKYAKLVDPTLTRPAVQINVGDQPKQINQGSAKEIAHRAMQELVGQGFTPQEITPQILRDYMSGKPVRRAIEGEVIGE